MKLFVLLLIGCSAVVTKVSAADSTRVYAISETWQKEHHDRAVKSYEEAKNFVKTLKEKTPNLYQKWLDEFVSFLHEISLSVGLIDVMKLCDFNLEYINSLKHVDSSIKCAMKEFYSHYIAPIIIETNEIHKFDYMRTLFDYVGKILKPNTENFAQANDIINTLTNMKNIFLKDKNDLIGASNKFKETINPIKEISIKVRNRCDVYEQKSKEKAPAKELETILAELRSNLTDINSLSNPLPRLLNEKEHYLDHIYYLHSDMKSLPEIVLDYLKGDINRLWTKTLYIYDFDELQTAKNNIVKSLNSFKKFKESLSTVKRKKPLEKDQIEWIDKYIEILEKDVDFFYFMEIKLGELTPKTVYHLITVFQENAWTTASDIGIFTNDLKLFINSFYKAYIIPLPTNFLNNVFDCQKDLLNVIKDRIPKLTYQLGNINNLFFYGLTTVTEKSNDLQKNNTRLLTERFSEFNKISIRVRKDLIEMYSLVQWKRELDDDLTKDSSNQSKKSLLEKIKTRLSSIMSMTTKSFKEADAEYKQLKIDNKLRVEEMDKLESCVKDIHGSQFKMANELLREFPDPSKKSGIDLFR